MHLYRFGPEGFFAASDEAGNVRTLYSDPFETMPGGWELGRTIRSNKLGLMAPIRPGKIVGVGRNFSAHVQELSSPAPDEPVIFLKSPSSTPASGPSLCAETNRPTSLPFAFCCRRSRTGNQSTPQDSFSKSYSRASLVPRRVNSLLRSSPPCPC